MLTTPEAFAQAGRLNTRVIEDIPGWNDAVTIQELSAQTLIDEIRKFDERTGMAKLIIASVANESGQLVFKDSPEHIALILSLAMRGVIHLAQQINEFNGCRAVQLKVLDCKPSA